MVEIVSAGYDPHCILGGSIPMSSKLAELSHHSDGRGVWSPTGASAESQPFVYKS